jgi:hypothetical protein
MSQRLAWRLQETCLSCSYSLQSAGERRNNIRPSAEGLQPRATAAVTPGRCGWSSWRRSHHDGYLPPAARWRAAAAPPLCLLAGHSAQGAPAAHVRDRETPVFPTRWGKPAAGPQGATTRRSSPRAKPCGVGHRSGHGCGRPAVPARLWDHLSHGAGTYWRQCSCRVGDFATGVMIMLAIMGIMVLVLTISTAG